MKKTSRTFIFEKTPAVSVVVKSHESNCHYREPRIIGKHPIKGCRCMAHCSCQKHLYVPTVPPYRPPTGFSGWEQAETFAQQWAEEHTRKNIEARKEEQAAAAQGSRKEIGEGFDAFIETKKPLKPEDSDAMWKKFRTIKKDCLEFFGTYNSGRAESEKIIYLDQWTLPLLEQWQGTWTLTTFHSINNRMGEITSFLDYCGMEGRDWVSKNVARALTRRKRNKEESQQTPPFTPEQYDMILKATDKMPTMLNRNWGQLMAAFIEVMRWCGSRISDTATMERAAIIDDPDAPGQKLWRYVALKNGRKIEVPIPDEVVDKLAALPVDPRYGPKHFFWSGDSRRSDAPDPWYTRFEQLWALCPPEALEVKDERNKQCDPHPHMFRHTFAVESRKGSKDQQGMSYAQIAVLIGDSEKTVKKYYAGYCKDFDKEAIAKARLVHRQIGKPVPTSLTAAQKEIAELRRMLAEVTPEEVAVN